jgi:dTDP-4-dehydrorhamnose 3,5-epimerase-like enzyme
MKAKKNHKIVTKDNNGIENGYLIPIYNVNDGFHEIEDEPKQVYLTVISKGCSKGPHLHYLRTGYFTCIKGDVKIVVKSGGIYSEYFSGENHDYLSVIIPKGVSALVKNIGDGDAFVLNMPSPAWTPTMNDEHQADFTDYISSNE